MPTLTETIATLRPGDVVTIEAGGKSRSVKVESVVPGRYVYVTSGAVRPGRVLGGCVRIADWGITYQPTMAQSPAEVTRIERHAALPFPAAKFVGMDGDMAVYRGVAL